MPYSFVWILISAYPLKTSTEFFYVLVLFVCLFVCLFLLKILTSAEKARQTIVILMRCVQTPMDPMFAVVWKVTKAMGKRVQVLASSFLPKDSSQLAL